MKLNAGYFTLAVAWGRRPKMIAYDWIVIWGTLLKSGCTKFVSSEPNQSDNNTDPERAYVETSRWTRICNFLSWPKEWILEQALSSIF
jgi:hypothetical protein